MKQTKLIMGMPVTVEIVGDSGAAEAEIAQTFAYFRAIDRRYSTYKTGSEISRINSGLPAGQWSAEMKHILELAEQTRQATAGFFNIQHNGRLDPSGLVKGWAVNQAARRLEKQGITDFCIEAGGDFQVNGHNAQGEPWRIGVRNPFQREEIVKVLAVADGGIATSGTAVRGQHIYNPHAPGRPITDIVSLTVVGPNCYEADRFATAAFAMGEAGLDFIESMPGLEGYLIRANKTAVTTSGFERYVLSPREAHAAAY